MAGLHFCQTRASDAEVAGAAQLQECGQRHSDGDLHREDLQENEQLTAHGHPARSSEMFKSELKKDINDFLEVLFFPVSDTLPFSSVKSLHKTMTIYRSELGGSLGG